MKKVAIVVDVSGSMNQGFMGNPRVFACGMESKEVTIPIEGIGSSIKPVNDIAKDFDIVYFFTDGYYYGRPSRNIKIMKLE